MSKKLNHVQRDQERKMRHDDGDERNKVTRYKLQANLTVVLEVRSYI